MAKMLLINLLFMTWAAAQPDTGSAQANRRDPFSGLMQDLGDMFLDVDEAIGRFISPPEARHDENSKEQIYVKGRNERVKYFDRIRENYKNVQDRLGETLRLPDLLSSNRGRDTKDSASFVDVKLPLVPLRVSVSTTNQEKLIDPRSSKDGVVADASTNRMKSPRLELPSFSSSVKLNDMELKVKAHPDEFLLPEISLTMGQNTPLRFGGDPSSTKSTKPEDKTNAEVTQFPEVEETTPISSTEPSYASRKGDVEGETGVQGRILGDVLYSETSFDKLVRRAIKDHGKWALDPTLFPNRRVDKVTSKHEKKPSSNFIRNSDLQRLHKEDLEPLPDNVPDSLRNTNQRREGAVHNGKRRPQDIHFNNNRKPGKLAPDNKILLAFTPDGVPLKLNVNWNLENPVEYLHEILDSAGVSLNLPVVSSDVIEPAGTEVLHIGYGNGGRSQALNIDISDKNQVKSLLKALRKVQKS